VIVILARFASPLLGNIKCAIGFLIAYRPNNNYLVCYWLEMIQEPPNVVLNIPCDNAKADFHISYEGLTPRQQSPAPCEGEAMEKETTAV
jgi:hypothetical protein